ncbi:MAG: dynamin family protein [Castellaniella sp.]|uniref:dynamin family protein n=1 Tax=Castellaniella sp. TaxID=1955812 RepID=UPI003C7705F9
MHDNTTRDDLIAAFHHLEKKFSLQKSDIAEKASKFDGLRTTFKDRNKELSNQLERSVSPENPLHDSIEKTRDSVNKQFAVWEDQVDARRKGTEFRAGFNDSLLVFIYGKVKSGKSSLGNYMAWGHSDPTAVMKAQATLRPDYFATQKTSVASGDQENEAIHKQQFRVGATEATSTIQGFTLPGLTWVDSPGLHSVNNENGDLAKEYVQHADLILYTMHSNAPGRASDMKEITNLLTGHKKFMVLLTGSDTTDEDEDSEGNVITTVIMKSDHAQKSQITYVSDELEKLKTQHNLPDSVLADVLPISTRYAEINPTSQAIADSGMGRLFTELKDIAEGEALKLKLHAPMGALRSSIRTTQNDLEGIKTLINQFAQEIDTQEDEIEKDLRSLGQEGRRQMSSYINQLFNQGNPQNVDTLVSKKLVEVLEPLTLQIIEKIAQQQADCFKDAFKASSLAKIPAYQEQLETREYFAGVRKGNKKWFSLGGTLLGGGIGFLVGGPAGAALGASLGSSAGLAGSSAKSDYRTHEVVVGDNIEERRTSAIQIYADGFPNILHATVEKLYAPTRDSMLTYCTSLKSEISSLSRQLDDLSKD